MLRKIALVACLGLAALWLLPLPFELWPVDDAEAPPGSAEQRTGLLSGFDLSDGHYTLVVSKRDPQDTTSPHDTLVRIIDDQQAIARYRDDIDLEWSWTIFFPGERSDNYYLYVFRGSEQVAGHNVVFSRLVKIPDALFEAGRPATSESFSGAREAYLVELDRLKAAGTLIRDADEVHAGKYEHYFSICFPTIVIPESEKFDHQPYASDLSERIARDISGNDCEIEPWRPADPAYDEGLIMDQDGRYLRDEDGAPLKLSGVRLYRLGLEVECEPQAHEAFRELDLASYVADKLNQDLLLHAWKEATGAETTPADIYIGSYFEGSVGQLVERTYVVRYWKPAE